MRVSILNREEDEEVVEEEKDKRWHGTTWWPTKK